MEKVRSCMINIISKRELSNSVIYELDDNILRSNIISILKMFENGKHKFGECSCSTWDEDGHVMRPCFHSIDELEKLKEYPSPDMSFDVDYVNSENLHNQQDDESSTGETASKYNFYVKLDNDKDLMMGQHVLIEQDNGQDEQKEGMWLPSAYIKKNNNKYYVWLDSHNKLKLHEIQVGEYDENLDEYEVKSGLKTSDYIACDDSTLKEGMKVTKVSPEDNTSGYGDEQENDDAESFGSDASEDTSDVGEDYSDYSDSADTYDSSDDGSLSDGADFGSDSSDSGNSGTSDSDIADFGE